MAHRAALPFELLTEANAAEATAIIAEVEQARSDEGQDAAEVQTMSQDDLCGSALEGDAVAVCNGLFQKRPALAANGLGIHRTSAFFEAYKTLLEIESVMASSLRITDEVRLLNTSAVSDLERTLWVLLLMGAEADCREEDPSSLGSSLLHLAVRQGNFRRVCELLRHGVAVDPTLRHTDVTPLMEAVRINDLPITLVLLRCGASVEFRDHEGLSCLHYAAAHGRSRLCKLLFTAGARKEARNRRLETPQQLAIRCGYTHTAEQLSAPTSAPATGGVSHILNDIDEYYRRQQVQRDEARIKHEEQQGENRRQEELLEQVSQTLSSLLFRVPLDSTPFDGAGIGGPCSSADEGFRKDLLGRGTRRTHW